MNMGAAPELIFGLLFFVNIGITIWGIVEAAQNHDTPWLIGIIAGSFIAIGWIVALIYVLAIARRRVAAIHPPPAASRSIPAPAAGWYADPAGHHEHRYWDGSNWTAAVSDEGVASTEPL